jgi:hypothetical protein
MPASQSDRDYFARIGAIKEELHAEVARDHERMTLSERLERSWALYLARRDQVDLTGRLDDPMPFYERARQLGLYEG